MNNPKSNHKTPRLNPIPANTVVHTPTEAEAKELLAILHENGYKWMCGNDSLYPIHYVAKEGFCIESGKRLSAYLYIQSAKEDNCTILTLAEFKERYCEEEKPQPKFKPGDKVKISVPASEFLNKYNGTITCVLERQMRGDGVEGWLTELSTAYVFKDEWLEPYTEPETKPTEDMETKGKESGEKGNSFENSQLNLCELLKGHEGETFYSPFYGAMVLISISDGLLCFQNSNIGIDLLTNGQSQYAVDGYCAIFPSKALYEQYPLDPLKAWMKWQEEQELRTLRITLTAPDLERNYAEVDFRTSSDRDKCIEEIKEVINKYSK